MTTSQIINQTLWRELRDAINKAYAEKGNSADITNDFACLRDYAENISWSDNLQKLLDREIQNERDHRRNRPAVPGFGASTGARLILMNCIVRGAEMKELPRSTAFLVLRQTAVEAEVIGWIIRDYIHPSWREAVKAYDYSELMQSRGLVA